MAGYQGRHLAVVRVAGLSSKNCCTLRVKPLPRCFQYVLRGHKQARTPTNPSESYHARLSDDMYSQEDVEGILNSLRGCVVTNLRQEVHRWASPSTVFQCVLFKVYVNPGCLESYEQLQASCFCTEVPRALTDSARTTSSGRTGGLTWPRHERLEVHLD